MSKSFQGCLNVFVRAVSKRIRGLKGIPMYFRKFQGRSFMNLLAFQDVSKSFGGGSFEEFFRNFRVRSRKFKGFPEVCQGVSSRFKTFQLIFG